MCTVPAQIFSAPTRAKLIAAARDMPWVCGTLGSSSEPWTTRTPWCFQWGSSGSGVMILLGTSQLLGIGLRGPPDEQPLFGRPHGEVENEREGREHEDAREHGVDVESALGLLDQVAHALGRAQV